ncbi:MAG: sigma-70 family RNA polymerase sigma factor [Tannerellaceae bacterium]
MELYTDTYYIQKVQAGDATSFGYLVDRYARQIHSLIYKVVRSHEDAEELAQDTFVKVFRNLSSFKGDSSFSTWIYRIAYNTAISATRKKRLEFLSIDETLINNVSEEEVANALWQTDTSEQLQRLDSALAQLQPDERALITLFYMKEKTTEETSFITGLSQSNVKTKLFRIRKKLFVLLKEMEDESI